MKEFLISYKYMDKMFRTRFMTHNISLDEKYNGMFGKRILHETEQHLHRMSPSGDYSCFSIEKIWEVTQDGGIS